MPTRSSQTPLPSLIRRPFALQWEEEQLAAIATVAAQLEVCAFRSVWKLLEPLAPLMKQIPGFEPALREFVLDTMQITYAVLPGRSPWPLSLLSFGAHV